MIGHLGSRVSALLDGQLPPDETERAWAHVHTCHFCRDQVEREGWVKTRLAGLSFGALGVWEIGAQHPDRFSALVPVASPGAKEVIDRLVLLPVWAFNFRGDWVSG